MKAIVIDGDKLIWSEVAEPKLGVGEVRIGVHASAVNRADLAQRAGGYPPPPGASEILGLECAGVVLEVGAGVGRVTVDDRVCALLAGGGYAEQVVVPAGQVLPIPGDCNMLQAQCSISSCSVYSTLGFSHHGQLAYIKRTCRRGLRQAS